MMNRLYFAADIRHLPEDRLQFIQPGLIQRRHIRSGGTVSASDFSGEYSQCLHPIGSFALHYYVIIAAGRLQAFQTRIEFAVNCGYSQRRR